MKKDSVKIPHGSNFFSYKRFLELLWILILLSFLLVTYNKAWAGGIYIHEDKIFLNGKLYSDNDLQKRKFPTKIPIEMEFTFDIFSYSGKPYEYIIFQIFRDSSKRNPTPIGYFTIPILRGQFHGISRFDLPYPSMSYEIKYHVVPYFSNVRLRTGMYGGFLSLDDIALIGKFYDNPHNNEYSMHLIYLKAHGAPEEYDDEKHISLYFINPK